MAGNMDWVLAVPWPLQRSKPWMFYALNLSQLEIFKIAALANLAVQDNGSCGDIAAVMVAGSLSQPSTILGSKNKKLSILSVSYLPWIGQVYPLSHWLLLKIYVYWLVGRVALPLLLIWSIKFTVREDKMVAYQLFLKQYRMCQRNDQRV